MESLISIWYNGQEIGRTNIDLTEFERENIRPNEMLNITLTKEVFNEALIHVFQLYMANEEREDKEREESKRWSEEEFKRWCESRKRMMEKNAEALKELADK